MTLILIIVAGLLLVTSIYFAWKNFQLIFDQPTYDAWFFTNEEPKLPVNIGKRKTSLTIKLPEGLTITGKTVYPIIVHGNLTIGFIFFYLLRVQYKYGLMEPDDETTEKPGWLFYSLNKAGKRKYLLNPLLTIRENGIRQNAVIEAVKTIARASVEPQNIFAEKNANLALQD